METRHLIKVFYIFFVSILVLNVSCVQQQTQWQGTVEEVGGVTVVSNPNVPLYGIIEFVLEEDLNINNDEDENSIFYRVGDIEVDSEGNIYVLDAGNFRVQKYDDKGLYLQTIGQKGQGPGEFQNPLSLFIDSLENLFVLDGREIDVFKKRGVFDRSIILETSIIDFFITKKRNILARVNPATEKENALIRLDNEGRIIDSIVEFSDVEYTLRKGSKKGSYVTFVTSHDYTPRLCFVPLNGSNFSFGFPLKYELFTADNTGAVNLIIKKEEKQQSINSREKKEILEELKHSISATGRVWPNRVLEEACNFPPFRPYFNNLYVDDKGRLYVMKINSILEGSDSVEFDLFNSQGFYLYRVIIRDYRITKPHSPRIIRGGFYYDVKEEEETGDVFIRRFKIKNWDQIKEGR